MCGRRGSTAARTSNGGWTPPACMTSAMTRSTTSSGRGGCRRFSWPARRSARTLDLNALTGIGVRLVGRLAGICRRKGAVLRFAAQQLRDGRPQDEPAADTIDEWATENGLDGEIDAPHRLAPTEVESDAAPRPGSRHRRDPDDRLGDGIPPGLFLARRAGSRSQGPDPPRWRGRPSSQACTSWACSSCAAANPP